MINFLPESEKKEFLLEETKRLVLILGVLLFLFLFSLALIFLSIKIYLSGEIQSQQFLLDSERGRLETKEIKDLKEQVAISNQKLSLVDEFYSQKINLVETLHKITKNIPQEIYLTDFAYSKNTSQISISGFSLSRDMLFQFKKNLEKDFQNVYFPPSNWVKSDDINFSGVSFQISP